MSTELNFERTHEVAHAVTESAEFRLAVRTETEDALRIWWRIAVGVCTVVLAVLAFFGLRLEAQVSREAEAHRAANERLRSNIETLQIRIAEQLKQAEQASHTATANAREAESAKVAAGISLQGIRASQSELREQYLNASKQLSESIGSVTAATFDASKSLASTVSTIGYATNEATRNLTDSKAQLEVVEGLMKELDTAEKLIKRMDDWRLSRSVALQAGSSVAVLLPDLEKPDSGAYIQISLCVEHIERLFTLKWGWERVPDATQSSVPLCSLSIAIAQQTRGVISEQPPVALAGTPFQLDVEFVYHSFLSDDFLLLRIEPNPYVAFGKLLREP